MWTSFFNWISFLFSDVLLAPYDLLRFASNWWLANSINWLFVIVGLVAGAYWMGELKKYHESGEENKDNSAHSFL